MARFGVAPRMGRKSGKDAGKRRAGSPSGGRKNNQKPSKKGSRVSSRTPAAEEIPDTSPLSVGEDGLLIAILETEHPDLLAEIRAEAEEAGTTMEATVITALRDAYGLPERFEPQYVIHLCPDCQARRQATAADEDDEDLDA